MSEDKKGMITGLLLVLVLFLTGRVLYLENMLKQVKLPAEEVEQSLPLPEELYFRGDTVAYCVNKQVLGAISDKKRSNKNWTYLVRMQLPTGQFTEAWMAEAELLLVEKSKAGNRPLRTKEAPRLDTK